MLKTYLPMETMCVMPRPLTTRWSSACSRRPRKTSLPRTSVGIHGISSTTTLVDFSEAVILSTEAVDADQAPDIDISDDESDDEMENVDDNDSRRFSFLARRLVVDFFVASVTRCGNLFQTICNPPRMQLTSI